MVIMRMTPCLQPYKLRLPESPAKALRGEGGRGEWGQCQHQLLQADLAVSRGEAWDFPSQAALPEHGGSEGLEQGACRAAHTQAGSASGTPAGSLRRSGFTTLSSYSRKQCKKYMLSTSYWARF